MTNRSKWAVPAFGFFLGLVIAGGELANHASAADAAIAFAIVAGYALGIGLLQSRSETAQLLTGRPVDERWDSINQRALAVAAQVMAVALAVAFVGVSFTGGNAIPYAIFGAVFAVSYLGGVIWYRRQS